MEKQKYPSRPHYEFTLAEFPVSILSKKDHPIKILEYRDFIEGKNGQLVERVWKVRPDSEFGFGGPSTIGTLFELFQIWKDDGFQERNIKFGSIYNLLSRKFLKAKKGKRVYDVVIRDLEALAHITFDAINAFWDNEKKAYVDIKGFKLFDYLALYKDQPNGQPSLPFSYIRVSEILWVSANKRSFFPISIRRELFHSFTPLEQRLALYLEKVFRSQSLHRRDFLKLAEQLPIEAKTTKHKKFILKRAAEGLLEKGYEKLEGYEFEKSPRRAGENVVFHRSGRYKPEPDEKLPKPPENPDLNERAEYYVEEILEVCQDPHSKPYYLMLARFILQQYRSADLIYRVLGEVKEMDREGKIKTNRGAYFTTMIKHYLREDGLTLPNGNGSK